MEARPAEAWPARRQSDESPSYKAKEEQQRRSLRSDASQGKLREAGGQKERTSINSSGTSTKSCTTPVQPVTSTPVSPYKVPPKPRRSRYKVLFSKFARLCGVIIEHKAFVFVSTLMTVWALIGDDLKLLTTDKPTDGIFDGIVIFCIVFFGMECAASCLGVADYFGSFFFVLDVLSTGTLFLDLTVVSEFLFGDSDSDPSRARTSRTARLGAKVGRMVRVLRLIRIVKLFKAFLAAKSKPKPRPSMKFTLEDDFEEPPEEEDTSFDKESLVGKKLSAKMTQWTILLVLTLLIVLPLLRVDMVERLPTSSAFAAEEVLEAYQRSELDPTYRPAYDKAVLRSLYHHNWYTGRESTCPEELSSCSRFFLGHAFWVGVGGFQSTDAQLRARALQTSLNASEVVAFDNAAATMSARYTYGRMPGAVVEQLSAPWTTECEVYGESYIGVSVLGTADHPVSCPTDLRYQEVERIMPQLMPLAAYDDWFFVFYYDLRPFVESEAAFSIATTVFLCVILCIASIMFTSTANALVLAPVEKMMQKVEAIRANPLAATKIADDEFQREERERRKKTAQKYVYLKDPAALCRTEAKELMETVILEKTIIKLGSLLALGFGEAGANIVSSNMDGANSGVNAMVEGSMVDCIVGVARILNFSTATEVLQGKVMTFVNQIAEIVHGVVDECWGAVNKNDGDNFLVIWRLGDMTWHEERKMADLAVLAFTLVVGAIHRSPVLATYRQHPGLQQRLSDSRVDLSFGLHRGWAIEGAVGSDFKIDASYISPNVSIANSIEQATRKYGVRILVSQTVANCATKEMASKMRLIDKVTIKGSLVPLELYCLDLDFKRLEVENRPDLPITWNSRYRFKSRHAMEMRKTHLWNDEFSKAHILKKDPHFQEMRVPYTDPFLQKFNMGYQNYSEGEWQVAKSLLTKTHNMLRDKDGPSAALLRFMEKPYGFKAPDGWRGVHALEDL